MVRCKVKLRLVWLSFALFICGYLSFMYAILRDVGAEERAEVERRAVVADEMNCSCPNRTSSGHALASATSTCDGSATLRGADQMVVSFSLFGGIHSAYFRGVSRNAHLVALHYPNWVMRVYHNLSLSDLVVRNSLCQLWCDHPHLDFCSMSNLPPPLMDQSHVSSKVWRFFALGDPLVSRFVSRDLDSLVNEREVAAVGQWLVSGKTWHFMRDHPLHAFPIMGGMWGGLNRNVTLTRQIRERLVEEAQKEPNDGNDQPVLRAVLLPVAEESDDYMNHDSFSCDQTTPKRAWPWPVKRLHHRDFVGNPTLRFDFPIYQHCPIKCRPPNHQDWEFC